MLPIQFKDKDVNLLKKKLFFSLLLWFYFVSKKKKITFYGWMALTHPSVSPDHERELWHFPQTFSTCMKPVLDFSFFVGITVTELMAKATELSSWAALNCCGSRCTAVGTEPPLSCVFALKPVAGWPSGTVGSGCWQLNLSHCRLRLCHPGRSGLGRVVYFTRHFAQRQEKAIGAECPQFPALPIFSIWTGTTFRT